MAKTFVITGAGDGLGRALARRFAKDGETVVLLGRTKAKVDAVAEEIGDAATALHCDITDPQSVRDTFAAIGEKYGSIDVLINNAGVFEPFSLEQATDEKIQRMMTTNLAGPIYCAREAKALLGKGGHIINVTSESVALRFPMLWMYEGTKASLEHVSRTWARELEPEGIRVTVVRAGSMMDETKGNIGWDPQIAMQFHQECVKVGLNLAERPISHYNSVTDAFRAVIDTPADLHIGHVDLCGWKSA